MKTFSIDISIKDLRNKLLDYIASHAHDEALVDIIISCINASNHSCARLYAKIAELEFPQREAVVEQTNEPIVIAAKKRPTVTWDLKYSLESFNEKSILAQVGEMKHLDLIVEDGRVFMKIEGSNNSVHITEDTQSVKGLYEGRKDYLGRSIVYHIPGGKYAVLAFGNISTLSKPKFHTSDGTEIKHEFLKVLQCSDVIELNSHVEKMKEAELVIVAGRAFAKFGNHTDGTTVIRMVEQSNPQEGKYDYLGNHIFRDGGHGEYYIKID